MAKIKKGDLVQVITGKKQDRGGDRRKQGHVLSVLVEQNRVIVEGVNIVKKHAKPNPMKGIAGGIVDKTMPIHQSNVAIFNAATGKADRVGVKVTEDGKKVRVFKSSGEEIKAA